MDIEDPDIKIISRQRLGGAVLDRACQLTNQSFAGSLRSHRTKGNVSIVLRFYKFDADVRYRARSASAAKQRDQKDQMLQQAVLHPGNLNREGKENKEQQ